MEKSHAATNYPNRLFEELHVNLATAIRGDQRWSTTPLIALSSHAEQGDIDAGKSAGFDEYLAKSDQTRLPENLARALRLAAISRETNDNQRRAS